MKSSHFTHNKILTYIMKSNPDYEFKFDDFVCYEHKDPKANEIMEWGLKDIPKPSPDDLSKLTDEEVERSCGRPQKSMCERIKEIENRLDALEMQSK